MNNITTTANYGNSWVPILDDNNTYEKAIIFSCLHGNRGIFRNTVRLKFIIDLFLYIIYYISIL